MRKHKRDCWQLCESNGLNVLQISHGGKHLKIICEEGVVTMPCTPGDWRWRHKAKRYIRRLSGNSCF